MPGSQVLKNRVFVPSSNRCPDRHCGTMSAHFPDAATLRSALSLATRAPSVHNSQPWRWRVGERSLHLYSDPDLHLPHTDPDARDLMLSCGAALNHCVVAFAALGWQSKIHRLPNPDERHRLASIELYRYPANEVDITLAAAIPRRRTDRRHYSAWPVPQGDLALMGARAARAGVTLRRVDELDSLKNLVSQAAMRHASDHDYLAELATWSGRYGATAGVPARSTPESDPTAAIPGRAFAGAVLTQTHRCRSGGRQRGCHCPGHRGRRRCLAAACGRGHKLGAADGDRIGIGQLPDHRAIGDSRNPCSRTDQCVRRRRVPTDAAAYRLGARQRRSAAVNPATCLVGSGCAA